MTLSKKQLLERRETVNASEIHILFNLSNYSSPLGLYYLKKGIIPAEPMSNPAYIGHLKETWNANQYKKRNPSIKLRRSLTVRDPVFRYAATPDRIATLENGEEYLVEFKASSLSQEWQGNKTPERFKMQVFWQMYVTKINKAVIVCDCGSVIHERTFEMDTQGQFYVNQLRSVADKFLYHLDNDKPPEIFGNESEAKTLGIVYPEDNGECVDVVENDELNILMDELFNDKKEYKEKAALILQKTNAIKEWMGENQRLQGLAYKASWKTGSRREVVNEGAVLEELLNDLESVDFRKEIALLTGHEISTLLEDLIAKHTVFKEGTRPFLLKRRKRNE